MKNNITQLKIFVITYKLKYALNTHVQRMSMYIIYKKYCFIYIYIYIFIYIYI